jgi:hypothetical protein
MPLPRRKRDKVKAAVPVPVPPPKPTLREHYRALLLDVLKAPIWVLFMTAKLAVFLTRILIRV